MNFMTDREAAEALLSHSTGKGPVNGGFATKLFEAFEKADVTNTARLLKGFPEREDPLTMLTMWGSDVLEKKIAEGHFD